MRNLCRYLNSYPIDLGIEASLALGESRTVAGAEKLIEAHRLARFTDLRNAHLVSLGLSRVPVAALESKYHHFQLLHRQVWHRLQRNLKPLRRILLLTVQLMRLLMIRSV